MAGIGVVCQPGLKANGITGSSNPVGDPYDIDYVAHEMGHEFGAGHTFNSTDGFCGSYGSSNSNCEPGSGSTIMAYAGICSPSNLQTNSDAYFTGISFDEITDYANTGAGNSCPVNTATNNIPPVVNAGQDYYIPLSTPFVLTGSATDANNDALTYCWEQVDVGGPFGSWNAPSGNAPIFRSFIPVTTSVRFFPKLSDVIGGTTTIGEIKPTYARTLNFRLTARDNKAAGGGVCKDEAIITTVAATGPFIVTYPTAAGVSWKVGDFRTVTWNTAGTALSPILCAKVTIQLSTDGGLTYPVTLASSTNNDGSEEIIVPNNITAQARVRVMAVGNVFYNISSNNFSIVAATSPTFNLSNPTPVYVCSAPSGSINLYTSSVNSFSTPINFTATSFPVGTSVSFSVNQVIPGGTTIVTLSNANTLANGTYTVNISGTAGSITKTRVLTFIVASISPSAPSNLILPANDTTGVNIKPVFNWSEVSGALSYSLEISKNSNFTNVIQTIGGISTLPYTMQTALEENTVYYWRVKTTNGCGEGVPSASPNRFKTGLNSCRISLDVPKSISSTGTPSVTSLINVTAAMGTTITDLNLVGLNITHSYIGDLIATLSSPAGTTVELFNQICGGQSDISMNLDDQATITTFPCPPINNVTVQPANPLSAFNGENSAGVWTLNVYDISDGGGGSLNGWGLSINTNANTCTFTATPLARTYTFTGNGNWNSVANWSGGSIPPNPLPSGETIVINHIAGGDCLLNVSQTISSGAGITILTGKNLSTQGNLTIQ